MHPVASCVLSTGFGTYCKKAPEETKAYLEYYTNAFRITQICRLAVIHYILREGWNAFWLDPDSALTRNPFQVMPTGYWVGACHPSNQRLMGPMRSKIHRNIGVMWIRSNVHTKRAQRQLILKMYYTREGRRAHDQYLFNDVYTDHNIKTHCLPYTMDGLSCNKEEHWGPHWPGPDFFVMHAACAPKGGNQKKDNTEGALATVRAQRNSWVYLGTLPVIIVTIKRPQERAKTTQKPLAFIWQPEKSLGIQVLCSQLRLFDGLSGTVHLGMVHRCSTTNRCHFADAVCARCNNTLKRAWLQEHNVWMVHC